MLTTLGFLLSQTVHAADAQDSITTTAIKNTPARIMALSIMLFVSPGCPSLLHNLFDILTDLQVRTESLRMIS